MRISGCLSCYFLCKEWLISNATDVDSQHEYSFYFVFTVTSIPFNLNYGICF